MGTMMKNNEDKLTVQIKGSGDFQSLTVTADRFGHVKGYPVPADVPFQSQGKDAFSLKKAFGKGTLTVMQDMGLKEPYVSQIPLQSGRNRRRSYLLLCKIGTDPLLPWDFRYS